jgi:drug/metabolite transporter (DMT)-like permease
LTARFDRVPRQRRWKAYGALVVAVLGIAWSAIFVRWAGVPGPASAFYRVFIASLVLLPWRALRAVNGHRNGDPSMRYDRRAIWLALAGGAFFGLDLALYNTAVLMTTASTATLLGNNAPIFVGIGSWLFLGRRPPRRFWVGLGLALLGGALVVITAIAGGRAGNVRGDLLALSAAVFFAAYMLTTERVREGMDTLTFSSISAVGTVVTLLVVCLVLGSPLAGYSLRAWAALVGLGLISQLTAYFALAYALGHLPATITAVGLLAQVPLTASLAVPLLGERLTAVQIIGGLLVLVGIYVVNQPGKSSTGEEEIRRR